MGCGVSRLDGIFFRRIEDMKIRNPPLLKHSTPSKKELLLHDPDENASSSNKINALKSTPSSPDDSVNWALKPEDSMEKKTCDKNDDKDDKKPEDVQNDRNYVEKNEAIENERSRERGKNDQKERMVEDAWMDADNEDEDEDEERMIGHEDDGAFPGSPSFRVYFKEDDEHDDTGKNDAFRDKVPSDDAVLSKECSMEKKVKSKRKKRSFRKALTKGLNVKSCYTSPRSNPDRTHLLEKTIA